MRIGTKSVLYFIYALTEPDGTTVRYIGITKLRNLNSRLCRHICDARKKGETNHRCCWLRSLEKAGTKPTVFLIEETCEPLRETFWIRKYRDDGFNLVNSSDGCESHIGYVPPPQVREAISRAKRGKPISEEHRAALRNSLIGRPISDVTRAVFDKYRRLKKSPETCEKIGASRRGKSNWSKGVTKPQEQRDKISKSLTGKKHTPETRAKMSAAHKGRPSPLKGLPWSAARREAHAA